MRSNQSKRTKTLMLIRSLLLLLLISATSSATQELQQPQSLALTCADTATLDPSTLTCSPCPVNQSPQDSSSRSRCVCNPGFIVDVTVSRLLPVACAACPVSMTSSFDKTFCLSCPTSSSTTAAGGTVCSCSQGQYLADKDSFGNKLTTAQCRSCPFASYPSPDLSSCLSCPSSSAYSPLNATAASAPPPSSAFSYSCSCPAPFYLDPQAGKCITAADIVSVQNIYSTINAQKVQYNSVLTPSGQLTSLTLTSQFMQQLFVSSVAKCKYDKDVYACQTLGNACVLQLYDETSEACKAYRALALERPGTTNAVVDWPVGMPWLYYGLISNQGSDVDTAKTVNLDVTFSSNPTANLVNKLPIVLAAYALNGTFLGLKPLEDVMQLCKTDADPTQFLKFGSNYQKSCYIDTNTLLKNLPETFFYDPYIIDHSKALYPLPVRLLNYRTPSGSTPNQNFFEADSADDKLTRRFFVFDTLSGRAGADDVPRVIRVPSVLTLRISKSTTTGKITTPVLEITYSERDTTLIALADISPLSRPVYTLSARYTMDYSGFWGRIGIVFALVCLTAVVTWGGRVYLWSKRNYAPSDPVDLDFLIKSLAIASGTFAFYFYFFLYLVSAYWLVFYKAQNVVYILIPTAPADLFAFESLVVGTLICQAIYLIYKISSQCRAEIFFMDWEKSKGRLLKSTPDEIPRPAPVSVWRSIFIAKAWVDLQTYRRVNVGLNLILMYFILEGLNVRYVTTPQPNSSDLTPGTTNPILSFGVNCSLWMALAACQIFYRFALYDRYYRNKLLQFVDMLSLSNISLFVLSDRFRGYYIHGKSVHGHADTDMIEMNENLKKEETDQVPRRGLESGSDSQMFEVFLTQQVRDMYDKVYMLLMAEKAKMMQLPSRRDKFTAVSVSSQSHPRPISTTQENIRAHESVNKFLCGFIERNFKEYSYSVRQRFLSDRLVPSVPDVSQGSIFYVDDATPFESVLLLGTELHLLLFLILLYNFLDMYIIDKPSVSLVLTFAVDLGVGWVRRFGGERNLERAGVMDKSFVL